MSKKRTSKKTPRKKKAASPSPVVKIASVKDKDSVPQSGNVTKRSMAPGKCLRQIDASTQLMSDNTMFPPVEDSKEEVLEKGYIRVDASTVIKAPSLGPLSKA